MRILACLHKTCLENLREWKVLSLALCFAPAFVFLMYGYFKAASPSYGLIVVAHDRAADGALGPESARLLAAWKEARHPDGTPVFTLTEQTDVDAARERVKARQADLLVEIPAGYSASIAAFRDRVSSEPARLRNHADERNVRGSMAMALSDYVAFTTAAVATAAPMPLDVAVAPIGAARPLSDFDLYVPALLVLALIMVLFTAATSLVKEVDRGTVMRLMLSRLRTAELLTAITIGQVFIGTVALGLTYGAARACGWQTSGSLPLVLLVGAVTTVAVVAIAVLTAAFLGSMYELLTVGTFPFFVLMFFSECMFPLPKIPLFELAGWTFHANDVLPTALGVRALGTVCNQGGDLASVAFELGAIVALTLVYFVVGTWLFRRRHLRFA